MAHRHDGNFGRSDFTSLWPATRDCRREQEAEQKGESVACGAGCERNEETSVQKRGLEAAISFFNALPGKTPPPCRGDLEHAPLTVQTAERCRVIAHSHQRARLAGRAFPPSHAQ